MDAFNFFFRETPHGIFIAHCYQYQPGRSTWVMETDPETFKRAGLDKLDEAASARFLEGVFAEELDGHKLITNRSLWRNFPTIRCERWTADNIVLIGDAKATAHFSIGSGTKLAMEDAIALYEAFRATGGRDVKTALARFEIAAARRGREDPALRRRVAGLVRARQAVLGHGPDALRLRPDDALEGDHLRQSRAARAGVRQARPTRWWRATSQAQGFDVDTARAGRADVPAVPAARHDARQPRGGVADVPVLGDRRPAGDWHMVHYGSRAIGGAGLMFTEMTDVSAEARITPRLHRACTTTRRRRPGSASSISCTPTPRAKFCLQLGHAGRKGATKLMWEGMDQPLPRAANWPIVSASPLPYYPHSQVPREMTRADMDAVIADFVQAVQRARARGLRHDRAARRARLSAGELHLAADQQAHRRIRRLAGEPPALSARGVPRHARGLAGRQADVGAHLGDRLAGRRAHRRRRRRRWRAPSPRPAAT